MSCGVRHKLWFCAVVTDDCVVGGSITHTHARRWLFSVLLMTTIVIIVTITAITTTTSNIALAGEA